MDTQLPNENQILKPTDNTWEKAVAVQEKASWQVFQGSIKQYGEDIADNDHLQNVMYTDFFGQAALKLAKVLGEPPKVQGRPVLAVELFAKFASLIPQKSKFDALLTKLIKLDNTPEGARLNLIIIQEARNLHDLAQNHEKLNLNLMPNMQGPSIAWSRVNAIIEHWLTLKSRDDLEFPHKGGEDALPIYWELEDQLIYRSMLTPQILSLNVDSDSLAGHQGQTVAETYEQMLLTAMSEFDEADTAIKQFMALLKYNALCQEI